MQVSRALLVVFKTTGGKVRFHPARLCASVSTGKLQSATYNASTALHHRAASLPTHTFSLAGMEPSRRSETPFRFTKAQPQEEY